MSQESQVDHAAGTNKILEAQQAMRREHQYAEQRIKYEAYKGGFIGLVLGLTTVLLVAPRYIPFISRLSPGGKTFIICGFVTTGVAIRSDHATLNVAREIWLNKNKHLLEKSASNSPTNASQVAVRQNTSVERTWMEFVSENKWGVCGTTWLLSVVTAFSLIMRIKGLPMTQKVIQTRMYAQGMAVAAIAAVMLVPPSKRFERERAQLQASDAYARA